MPRGDALGTARPEPGIALVHTVVDDHSRVAHVEMYDDETAAATAVLARVMA